MAIDVVVMMDTVNCCKELPELKDAIKHSIAKQYMVVKEEKIELSVREATTKILGVGQTQFRGCQGIQEHEGCGAELCQQPFDRRCSLFLGCPGGISVQMLHAAALPTGDGEAFLPKAYRHVQQGTNGQHGQ